MRISDWSSDVCSSDLSALGGEIRIAAEKIEHRVAARRCGRENEARKELRIRRLTGLIQGRNLERFAPARFEINAVRWRIDDTNLGRRHLVDTSMIFEPKGSDELKFRSEEHTSELQSLMRISYAVFCLKKKKSNRQNNKDL